MKNNKIRILLIEPSEPWITNNMSLQHLEQVMVPLGLMSLSAYLKEKLAGQVEIKLINTLVDLDSVDDIAAVFREFSPQIVGIRCVIFYTHIVKNILKTARQVVPDALRILGGPHVTCAPDTFSPDDAEIMVQGEGEVTFYEIVRCFSRFGKERLPEYLPEIKGIIYTDAGKVATTGARAPLKDLDQLPIPDYSLINFEKYKGFLNYGYNRRPMASMFTSRGCPYHCIYCHQIFGKRFRGRSAAAIYKEIRFLHDVHGIRDFCIVDDNFNADKTRIDLLTRQLINKGPEVNLYFPNGLRGDILSLRLFDQLIKAGTIYVSFSLETTSPRLQRLIRKNIDIGKLQEIIQHSCESNIITNLAMMVGFPTETVEEARRSLEYLAQFNKLVLPYYFCLKYYPGTELHLQAKQYGIQVDNAIFESPYHGYQFQETPQISQNEFEALNLWYLRNIFLNPQRIQNAVSILSRYFTTDEVNEMFSLFFRKPITDIESDVIKKNCVAVESYSQILKNKECQREYQNQGRTTVRRKD